VLAVLAGSGRASTMQVGWRTSKALQCLQDREKQAASRLENNESLAVFAESEGADAGMVGYGG
jgi:hypothetical protein